MSVTKLTTKAKELRSAWSDNRAQQFALQFDEASTYEALRTELGEDAYHAFLYDNEEGLGLNATAATRALAMAQAVRQVPQKTVWLAIGWFGVSKIRKADTTAQLRAVVQAIMVIHKKLSRPLKDGELTLIMEQHMGTVMQRLASQRKSRHRVYEEREILADAVRFAVKKHPALHTELEKHNATVLTLAGLPRMSGTKAS